jgi:hypothetical protein
MPEALTKRMFGLPRWAWLAILAAAIGIGLYLRHQQKVKEEEEAAAGTSSEESPVGVVGSEAVPVGGYDQTGEGGGYYYGYSPGGGYGGYEGFEQGYSEHEVNINVEAPQSLPMPPTESAPPASGGGAGRPCTATHPKPPAGHHYECVNGRWKLVAGGPTHAGGNVGTGGGPPNRPNNKGPASKPPTNNPQHPDAVNTGNRCVNGGVGGHTAPPGYHLFCDNGWIWRAPNTAGNKGGGGGGSGGGGNPAPAPAPAPQQGWCGHPNAVPTGNPCVNGGTGKHTAPPGYHLFCCNGMIGRAPN